MVLQHYQAVILGYENNASSYPMTSIGCVPKKQKHAHDHIINTQLKCLVITDFNTDFPLNRKISS